MNKLQRIGKLNFATSLFIKSLLTPKSRTNHITVPIIVNNANEADQITEEWDPSKIKQLKIIKIALPSSQKNWNSERNRKNMKKFASIYSAEERTERVVLFQYNGEYFYSGFTLLQYQGKWCIEALGSMVSNTGNGLAERCTLHDFERRFN